MDHDLAIIIPAYKEAYFELALQSLASQTCKNFNLYIGDDASPADLKTIAGRFSNFLDISYTRFDNNIGAKNLVNQWARSVALSKNEKWVWLFSDDDIADPTCVEDFYRIAGRNKDRFDVYRFNTCVIDKQGSIMYDTPVGPTEETSEQMAYNLLMGERGNSMPDHIFTREVYRQNGGFVFTDYAQGADWATSILFSQKKGLAIIPGSKIYWRYSGINISSSAAGKRNQAVKGHMQFLGWVLQHFDYLKKTQTGISYDMFKTGIRTNIRNVFTHHYRGLTAASLFALLYFMRRRMKMSMKIIVADLLSIDVRTGNHLEPVARIKALLKRAYALRAR